MSRKRDKQIDMRSCLSEASSSNDYDNITSGLWAQDVFGIILNDISFGAERNEWNEYKKYKIIDDFAIIWEIIAIFAFKLQI